jgi:hypothetical protein
MTSPSDTPPGGTPPPSSLALPTQRGVTLAEFVGHALGAGPLSALEVRLDHRRILVTRQAGGGIETLQVAVQDGPGASLIDAGPQPGADGRAPRPPQAALGGGPRSLRVSPTGQCI